MALRNSQTTNVMSFADNSNTRDSNSISAGVFGETPTSLTTQDQTNDPKGADDATNLEMLCLRSAGADPHYFGSSSAYSFTKIFSASLRAVRSKAPGMSLSGVADSFTQSRPAPNPVPLPDRSLTTMLTSAYFEQIHPQFPFLHRPTYAQWEEEVLQACEQGYAPEPTKAFFVYAVSPSDHRFQNDCLIVVAFCYWSIDRTSRWWLSARGMCELYIIFPTECLRSDRGSTHRPRICSSMW